LSTAQLLRLHDSLLKVALNATAAKVIDAYPWLESSGVIDVLLPKKEQICVGKWCAGECHVDTLTARSACCVQLKDFLYSSECVILALCSPDHVQIVIIGGQPLFFAQRDGPWFPTLRLLHQYPQMMVSGIAAAVVARCRLRDGFGNHPS
jgi:hypothetical protein